MDGMTDDRHPAIDRKQEHEFRATRPGKDLACIVPGCAKKFRPSTDYSALLIHLSQKHPKVVIHD